jgi:hypothetical protein
MADLNPADLDGLIALHAQTTQGTWVVLPEVHQDTRVGLEGRGFFGLIADVSTAPDDYGRANAAFIAASHRLMPAVAAMAAELAEARRQLAGDQANA